MSQDKKNVNLYPSDYIDYTVRQNKSKKPTILILVALVLVGIFLGFWLTFFRPSVSLNSLPSYLDTFSYKVEYLHKNMNIFKERLDKMDTRNSQSIDIDTTKEVLTRTLRSLKRIESRLDLESKRLQEFLNAQESSSYFQYNRS